MSNEYESSTYGENFQATTLPCGLPVHTLSKPDYHYKNAILSVNFGSANTDLPDPPVHGEPRRLPLGTAHFLEHRLFERNGEDITDAFTALGAEVNAHTGYTSTDFVVSCVDRLEDCIDLLLTLAMELESSEDGIAREREIIGREIEHYSDSLEWMSYFSAMRTMYPDSALAVDMAGTKSSIDDVDAEILLLAHRTWYRPGQMSLFLSGDLEHEQIVDFVGARVGVAAKADFPIAERKSWRRPWSGKGRERTTLDISRPRLCLGFRDVAAIPDGLPLLKRELAADVALDVLFGPASEFYSKTYEKGLIDQESFDWDVYVEPEFGHCLIGGDADRPEQLEEAIVGNLRKAISRGLPEVDFSRAKRKALGNLIEQFNDVDGCTSLMHSAVSRGGAPVDFFAAHTLLTLDDVLECIGTWLHPDHYALSLVEPRRDVEVGIRRVD